MDQTAILWKVDAEAPQKCQKIQAFDQISRISVQGVAIDPLMSYICFLTQEGWLKVYKNKDLNKRTEFFHKHTIKGKESLSAGPENEEEAAQESKEEEKKNFKQRLFLGSEEYKVFFRRFAWSPDGSFLLTPSAIFQESADGTPEFTVYGFLRGNLVRPAFTLPGLRYTATGVAFS